MMFTVDPDAVKNINSLRFLKIYNSDSKNVHGLKFPKEKFLPSTLTLLHWENYPFKSLPEDFDHRELVELNMPYSQLEKLRARTEVGNAIQLSPYTIHYGHIINFNFCSEPQDVEKDQALSFPAAS